MFDCEGGEPMNKIKEVIMYGQNICKRFSNEINDNYILDNINLNIYKDDFTVIMGPSGAGKSTLLYILSGMDKATSGDIFYKEMNITSTSEKKMADLRGKEFGFVFQQTHLVSYLTLYENVIVAGYANSSKNAKEIQERAIQLLDKMKVSLVENHLPSQVSGGEAQRAAIARALINEPGIIFADEPTGALNKANSEQVLDLMSEVHQLGQSIIMVTHDLRAALRGTRLIYIEDGKIIGEKQMPKYNHKDVKQREMEIQEWLSSMKW